VAGLFTGNDAAVPIPEWLPPRRRRSWRRLVRMHPSSSENQTGVGEQNQPCDRRRNRGRAVVLGCERLLMRLALPHCGAPFPFAVVAAEVPIAGWRGKPVWRPKTAGAMDRSLICERLLNPLALPHFGAPFPFGPAPVRAGKPQIHPLRYAPVGMTRGTGSVVMRTVDWGHISEARWGTHCGGSPIRRTRGWVGWACWSRRPFRW
jgi:hypothetical protein